MTSDSKFHVFLSHPHQYAAWVEALARRLEDEYGFRVWLDRWMLVPGTSWQQEMVKGLEEAQVCAICVGRETPKGWFHQEVQKALNRQASEPGFRVIPILLPDAPLNLTEVMPAFLDLRTWADFREGSESDYAFHVLIQGIKGEPPGRWPFPEQGSLNSGTDSRFTDAERKMLEFRKLREAAGEITEEVRIEYEKKILSDWFGEGI
jgi:hypothetical protein